MEDTEDDSKREKTEALGDRNALPKTPDFKEWGVAPRKGSPFILDDYRGVNAYRKTKV